MSTMSYASIWNETLQKIQESNYFDSHTFNSWISKTTLFKIEDNIAYITIVGKAKAGKNSSIETMLRRDFYNVFKDRLKGKDEK